MNVSDYAILVQSTTERGEREEKKKEIAKSAGDNTVHKISLDDNRPADDGRQFKRVQRNKLNVKQILRPTFQLTSI